MLIKIKMYYLTLVTIATIRQKKITNASKNMKKRQLLYTVAQNSTIIMENSMEVPQKK